MNKDIKEMICDTYTPENYYMLWLYMYAMVGEGFIAATGLLDKIKIPEELWDNGEKLDKLADNFLKELQGE